MCVLTWMASLLADPEYGSMDLFHYNAAIMRNKSLAAGIPMWNYVCECSNRQLGPSLRHNL